MEGKIKGKYREGTGELMEGAELHLHLAIYEEKE